RRRNPGPVGELPVAGVVGAGEQELRVAETLNDEQHLRVPRDALGRQPRAQRRLGIDAGVAHPAVPLRDAGPGAALQQPDLPLAHLAPVLHVTTGRMCAPPSTTSVWPVIQRA